MNNLPIKRFMFWCGYMHKDAADEAVRRAQYKRGRQERKERAAKADLTHLAEAKNLFGMEYFATLNELMSNNPFMSAVEARLVLESQRTSVAREVGLKEGLEACAPKMASLEKEIKWLERRVESLESKLGAATRKTRERDSFIGKHKLQPKPLQLN